MSTITSTSTPMIRIRTYSNLAPIEAATATIALIIIASGIRDLPRHDLRNALSVRALSYSVRTLAQETRQRSGSLLLLLRRPSRLGSRRGSSMLRLRPPRGLSPTLRTSSLRWRSLLRRIKCARRARPRHPHVHQGLSHRRHFLLVRRCLPLDLLLRPTLEMPKEELAPVRL